MARFCVALRTVMGDKPLVEAEYGLTLLGYRFMAILPEARQCNRR